MSLVDVVEMIDEPDVECLDVGWLLLPVLLEDKEEEEEEDESNDELLSLLVLVLALLGDWDAWDNLEANDDNMDSGLTGLGRWPASINI